VHARTLEVRAVPSTLEVRAVPSTLEVRAVPEHAVWLGRDDERTGGTVPVMVPGHGGDLAGSLGGGRA
jgi:hypothetical protein